MVFALVDCNSFFCSCERLFRPDLKNVPVGVLSNNDGCFVSRTHELKALGVPMGAPYFKYRTICEKNSVAVFSANFSLYTNLSNRVMLTLGRFTPQLEIYSVDEAFLDLTHIPLLELESYCRKIKKIVEKNTGIPVSIGVAPTKTLAKVANYVGKKKPEYGGVIEIVSLSKRDPILKQVEVENIWGVGRQSAKKLRFMGIKNALEFRNYNNQKHIQSLFTITGRQIQEELRGVLCHQLTLRPEKKKGILSSRTFGAPVYDLKSLREAVANYASVAMEKLRKQGSVCRGVEVLVRTNPHKKTLQYYARSHKKFTTHTSNTFKVIRAAWEILDELYRPGIEYKKAMVILSDISDREQTQTSLFEEHDSQKSEILMLLMDKINRREGRNTLRSGACGTDQHAWKMRQTLKSPRYTSGWHELPKV